MDAYVDPTKEVFRAFRENDRAGPIHMLNLVKFHDTATYEDGHTCPGAEAYAAYGRDSGPVFERLGGRIVWRGVFELMLIAPKRARHGMRVLSRNTLRWRRLFR